MKDIFDTSYNNYILACKKFNVIPIDISSYKDYILDAGTTLSNIEKNGSKSPYVIYKINDIYLRCVKINDSLNISFLDEESYNIIKNYKE